MYILEIKEAFLDYSKGDKKEAYLLIKDILEDIENEGVEYYKQLLADECVEDSICPLCLGELQPTEIGSDITEAWGRREVTPIYALICEDCGGLVE